MSQITSIMLPFFALIGLGWIGGKFKLVSPDGMRGINGFVFYLALPALSFPSLATRNPSETRQPHHVLAHVGPPLALSVTCRSCAADAFVL